MLAGVTVARVDRSLGREWHLGSLMTIYRHCSSPSSCPSPCVEVGHSHSLMAARWMVASWRTASLSNLVATARLRLSRLMLHSTAWRRW